MHHEVVGPLLPGLDGGSLDEPSEEAYDGASARRSRGASVGQSGQSPQSGLRCSKPGVKVIYPVRGGIVIPQ